jgi:hypothetical protein
MFQCGANSLKVETQFDATNAIEDNQECSVQGSERPATRDSKHSQGQGETNTDEQPGQWQDGDMSMMANGDYNNNIMNGAFPMDYSQVMANGMQMPTGGFPNMMGKFHNLILLQ